VGGCEREIRKNEKPPGGGGSGEGEENVKFF